MAPEDESNFQRVYWHTLGTAQEADRLVYERPDFKELGFAPRATDDGAYLTLHVWRGTEPENRFYYAPLDPNTGGHSAIVRLLDEADARYDFIDNAGSLFYFVTDLDAPRGRVIAIDVQRPQREHWREIIPQGDDPIDQATLIHDELIVVTLHDVHHRVQRYSRDGALLGEIALPGLGTVAGISGRREDARPSWASPGTSIPLTTLRYDFASGELTTLRAPELDFDASLLRDPPGLLPLQGRHPHPHVPHPPQGARPGRRQPHPPLRLRRASTSPSPRPSPCTAWPGWSRGACWPWPTCAGGRSTARPGTRPASWSGSRTSSTTSSPAPSG